MSSARSVAPLRGKLAPSAESWPGNLDTISSARELFNLMIGLSFGLAASEPVQVSRFQWHRDTVTA